MLWQVIQIQTDTYYFINQFWAELLWNENRFKILKVQTLFNTMICTFLVDLGYFMIIDSLKS